MSEITSLSLSPSKAGKKLGVSRTKVLGLVREGRLSAVVFGNRIHITMASIEALHASLPGYVPGQMPDLHPRNPLPKKRTRRELA